MLSHPELTDEKILKMEKDALTSVRAFAKRECGLDTCLEALLAYDQFVTKKRISMEGAYRRTLEDRPWERCKCTICQTWGIEVAIFRGNNRNRRRGFHNTYVFYQLFKDVLEGKRVAFLNNNGQQLELPFRNGEYALRTEYQRKCPKQGEQLAQKMSQWETKPRISSDEADRIRNAITPFAHTSKGTEVPNRRR